MWVRLAEYLVDLYVERFGRPDLLHAHSVLWGGYAAMLNARRHRIPYLITEHSTAYTRGLVRPWQEPYIRESLSKASQVIVVSRSLAKLMGPYLGGKKSEVIPNLVNTDFFSLPPRPRSNKPFRFLTVALLTPKKGIDTLIRAFAQAFRDRSDVCLEVGGNGPQRVELERLSRVLGLEHRVRFLGHLSREDVRNAMWRADAFVLPSHTETFGVVVIEALATGLPVIATRSGGPEEIITGQSGLLVPPGDVESLACALCDMIHQYEQWDVGSLRASVAEKYSEGAVVSQLLKTYASVRAA